MKIHPSAPRPGPNPNQLTPRGAIVMGILFIAAGAFPVLISLGIVQGHPAPGVPSWVGVAAGSMFILAGLAIINGYAVAGGTQPNGDLSAGAPFLARVVQYLLGVAIIGLMFAVFAWVSFGPGERHFSSSVSVPGLSLSGHSSERSGRIAFGIATVLIGSFFALATVCGAKRLWRGRRGAPEIT
jgi:hypothetical protein